MLGLQVNASVFNYTRNGVKSRISEMTNYAFQRVDNAFYEVTALDIHFIKCAAKALIKFICLIYALKGVVSYFSSCA